MSFYYQPALAAAATLGTNDYVLTAEAGSFVLDGQAVWQADYTLVAETGEFVLDGKDINPPAAAYSITAEHGMFFADGRSFNQPIAAGSSVKVVTLGDSIFQRPDGPGQPARMDSASDGELHWVKARGKAGFRHDIWYAADARWMASSAPLFKGANQGRSGDWATGVRRRLTAVINMAPDIVVLNVGTNTGPAEDGNTAAQPNIDELAIIVPTLVNAGIKVVIGTIRPRATSTTGSSGTFTFETNAAFRTRIETINAYIRSLDDDTNVFVWDTDKDMLDPNPVLPLIAGSPYRWSVIDGVHLSTRGAAATSRGLYNTLDRVLGDGTWFDSDASVSNAVTNGVLAGTGGTVGAGVTGQAPNNMSISAVAASAFVTVASSRTDDGWHVDVTCLGGGSSTSNTMTLNLSSAAVNVATQGWTSTTWVKTFFEVEVSNGETVGGLYTRLLQVSTERGQAMKPIHQNRALFPMANLPRRGWIECYPQQVGSATSLTARLVIEPRIDIAGDFRVTVKSIIMRETDDPTVLFPYDPQDPGVFAVGGQDVRLTSSIAPEIEAEVGTFAAAGQDVTISVSSNFILTADAGSFGIAGQDVALPVTGVRMSADVGVFNLSGQPVELTAPPPPAPEIPVNIPILLRSRVRGRKTGGAFLRSDIGFRIGAGGSEETLPDGVYLTDGLGNYLTDSTGAFLLAGG